MTDADLDPQGTLEEEPVSPLPPTSIRPRRLWTQGMACVAILPLLGFIGQSGQTLWGEWKSLRQARVSERASAIVGYVNITPNISYAARPADWFRDDGESMYLWSGWKGGENRWFQMGRGEIDRRRISLPIGRDMIQAIDVPLYEADGGERWSKIPDEALVAGYEGGGSSMAYPLKILDKVEVINELNTNRPMLLAFTPVAEVATIFEATFDGVRVQLGHSGYFFGNHPIFYDRATESLWTEQDGAMVAVAGRRKGAKLAQIARLPSVPWSDWRAGHSTGKLLIGADRSQAVRIK